MTSQQTVCGKTIEAPIKAGALLGQMLRSNTCMEAKPQEAASLGQNPRPLETTQRCLNIVPGNCPENSIIVREALRMNLPLHLVLVTVQRRVQTQGANYADIKELVADLFAANNGGSCTGNNQEVPMETNQLEEALMMNSVVVRKALRMGVPPHLIKPKVRAKILSKRVGYADVSELLTDLNMQEMNTSHFQ